MDVIVVNVLGRDAERMRSEPTGIQLLLSNGREEEDKLHKALLREPAAKFQLILTLSWTLAEASATLLPRGRSQ